MLSLVNRHRAWGALAALLALLLPAGPVQAATRLKSALTNSTAEVKFQPAGGLYTNAPVIRLAAAAVKAVVHYTTDGKEPTTNSPVYAAPFAISRSLCVRARAFVNGLPVSPVSGAAYTLLEESAAAFNSNLPILVLSTFGGYIGDDDKRPAYLTVIDTHNGRASLRGDLQFQGRVGIELRGSTSMRAPKRCYGLELDDETTGDDKKAPLLGMPAESDWVLYAPYNDKSLMRDVLAYDVWESMGHYSVRRRFVEVFLQRHTGPLTLRDYAGIYVLLEKIKQGKHRVDIAKLTSGDTNPPAISGGYILKKDRLDGNDNPFTTRWGHTLGIEYPKGGKLTGVQAQWIRQWMNEFESALLSTNFMHPDLGYRKYLDVPTAIDYFWIVEMSKTIDGYTYSVFMHKDRNGKLVLSPIWDRNLSFGNANYQNGDDPRGWYFEEAPGRDLWYHRLFQDPEFMQALIDRWAELRRGSFATSKVLDRVDKYAALLDEAKDRDFARWPRLGVYVWPNADGDWPNRTYADTVKYLKTFIIERLAWYDRQFVPIPVANAKAGAMPRGFQLAFTNANTNAALAIYYTLNGADPRCPGGAVLPQAREYKEPFRIDSKISVFARARDQRGNWGPPLQAVYSVK